MNNEVILEINLDPTTFCIPCKFKVGDEVMALGEQKDKYGSMSPFSKLRLNELYIIKNILADPEDEFHISYKFYDYAISKINSPLIFVTEDNLKLICRDGNPMIEGWI